MGVILTSNPSSILSAGTWATTTNVYTSDNTYATNVGTTQNTEYPMDVGGFNFAAIGDAEPINSVTISIEAKTTTASRAQIKGELYDGATPLTGSLALTNLTAADTFYTFNATGVTVAQLKSANLKVRVTNKRTASQASTTSVDHVKITVDYGATPKLETFTDDFATQVDKVTKWPGSSAPVVWDASGRAKIPVTTAYSALGQAQTGGYDLTGSYLIAQLTINAAGSGTGARETFFEIDKAGGVNDRFSMFVSGTDFIIRRYIGGSINGTYNIGTYNPTTHAWWRIRESGGNTYFGYSANGTDWTEPFNIANGFAVTNVWVNISSGLWGDATTTDTFIDNVNVPPGGAQAATATGSLSLAGAAIAEAQVLSGITGSITLAGTATAGQPPQAATATGSLSLVGTATAGARITSGITGSLALAGTTTAGGRATGITGSLALAGTATARAGAAATGALVLTGTASVKVSITVVGSLSMGGSVSVGAASGRPKITLDGSTFIKKPGKVYMGVGPGFVEKPWKRWNGSTWKTLP